MSKNEKGKRNNMKSIKSKAKTNIYLMQPLDEYPHKKNIHTINATHKKILLIILAIILLILISNVNDKIRKQKEAKQYETQIAQEQQKKEEERNNTNNRTRKTKLRNNISLRHKKSLFNI